MKNVKDRISGRQGFGAVSWNACWRVLLVFLGGVNVWLIDSERCVADLIFAVEYTAEAEQFLSEGEKARIQAGLDFWDGIIDGYKDGKTRTWTMTVGAYSDPRVNGRVTLGSALVTGSERSDGNFGAQTADGRYTYATSGLFEFNTHPDAGEAALTDTVIQHEIGHLLGFGTLWEENGLYDAVNAPGVYTGVHALEAFKDEFMIHGIAPFPIPVPEHLPHLDVELSGGEGTAHSHWDESDDLGISPLPIFDSQGRNGRDELMTGYTPPTGETAFLSQTSIQSYRDIGFTLHPSAVPEPSGFLIVFLISLASAIGFRRKVHIVN